MEEHQAFHKTLRQLIWLVVVLLVCVVASTGFFMADSFGLFQIEKLTWAEKAEDHAPEGEVAQTWRAPDSAAIPSGREGELIRYGRELIAHTSVYLGPNGKVGAQSNGMNCQNCHLKAGTVPFGNNFGAVATKYPVFRSRSGTVEDFEKRVNDCIERSLDGEPLKPESREMQAMVAYLKWVGKDVKKGEQQVGFGLKPLSFLDRPADPDKGAMVYETYCLRCHGADGKGEMAQNGLEYLYPPLFGDNSYNTGAGLFRLSRFAAFVKYNMPLGTTHENPFLTDEEAWDVAAYINSMPRPAKTFETDWPDISRKPFDHPFGPYADTFSEQQHKYGPYQSIAGAQVP